MPASYPQLIHDLRRLVTPAAEPSDAELLDRFRRAHDEAAFTALVRRHGPLVWRLCCRRLDDRHAAEDAFQATFLVLARHAAAIRRPAALPAWLYGVALRVIGKARRQRPLAPLPCDVPAREEEDPLAKLTLREALALLDDELLRLPEKYRLPVLLCGLEGRSLDEAARQLGVTMGALRGRLERGRARLHARLVRRGVTLTAALAAVEITRAKAAGALPGTLVFAQPAGISAAVLALAQDAGPTMLTSTLKPLALLVLVLGLAALGAAALQTPPTEKPVDEAKPARARTDAYGDPLPPAAIARLGSLRLYHGQRLWQVILSPDGKMVASRSDDYGRLRLWDTANGQELPCDKRFQAMNPCTAAGNLVAVEEREKEQIHWDLRTGKEVRRLPSGPLSPDGKTLFVGREDARFFRDLASGKETEADGTRGKPLWKMEFAADGQTLLGVDLDLVCHAWDVATGKRRSSARLAVLKDFHGHEAFSPDGAVLATSVGGAPIQLWDVRTGQELPAPAGQPRQNVNSIAWSRDSKLLAATYPNPTVRIWDVRAARLSRTLQGQGSQVYTTAFAADGRTLAGADGDAVTLWDLATGKPRHDFGHTYTMSALRFSPDGRRLASGAAYTDTAVRVWDAYTGRRLAELQGHRSGIEALAYAPDGRLLASGSQDGTVKLWDTESAREVHRLAAKDGMVYALAFAPDGKTLASGGRRKAAHLWDVATGRELRSFDNPGGLILCQAFTPDGRLLATRGVDEQMIRLWDVSRGQPLRTLACPDASCPCLDFSPDGKELAAGGNDGVVRSWDVATGALQRTFTVAGAKDTPHVYGVAFSPDGRSLAVGYSDHVLRLWEVASGQQRAQYLGHESGVMTVCFSPDGKLLASGSGDRTGLVWDLTGRAGTHPLGPVTAALWTELAADAARAFRAEQQLLHAGPQAIALLRQHLQPAPPTDGARLARLVRALDSEQFAERQRASRELRELGEAAESALRKALAGDPSVELRRRATEILDELAPSRNAEQLRRLRAVEVLEHLGSIEARQLLETLAAGAAEALLTRKAKASLDRLLRLR